jgi:hypothetical protein
MPTVHDLIRSKMYSRMGIETKPKRDALSVSIEIKSMTRKLDEIIALAKPRLIMGGIRYGSNWNHEDLMSYMQEKFNEYKTTGNFEMLVDLFNFVVIEGQLKTHPKFNFTPKDRK